MVYTFGRLLAADIADDMAEHGLKKMFSSLLGKRDEEPEQSQTGASQSTFEETVIRLRQLETERSFVDVRFPGRSDKSYQSLILKVNPLERFVLIDELFPTHGALFVSPGDEVEITSVRKGIPLRFTTWVKSISIDEADGIPAYRLAFPHTVEAKQRRSSFRVAIDPGAGLRLRIRGPDGDKLLCTVQNLSYGGVGFTCQGNLTERLRQSHLLRASLLSIPGLADISCDLAVRSFEFRRNPYRHTVVGARMESLNAAAERQLKQFLANLQRQQRRESEQS